MANRKGESFVAGITLLVIGLYLVMERLAIPLPAISYYWLLTIILITIGIMAVIKVKYILKLVGLAALVLGVVEFALCPPATALVGDILLYYQPFFASLL